MTGVKQLNYIVEDLERCRMQRLNELCARQFTYNREVQHCSILDTK